MSRHATTWTIGLTALAVMASGCSGGMLEELFKKKKKSEPVSTFGATAGGAASDPVPEGERTTVDRVAAVVNTKIITLSEVIRRGAPLVRAKLAVEMDTSRHPTIMREVYTDMLDELINDELLAQEAAKLGLTVPEAELDLSIKSIRERAGLSEEAFKEELAKSGFSSMKLYRKAVRSQLLRLKVISLKVRPKIAMGEDVLKAYYERLKSEVKTGEEVHLVGLMLSIPAREEPEYDKKLAARFKLADEIKARLEAGEAHTEIASAMESLGVGDFDLNSEIESLRPAMRVAVTPMKKGNVKVVDMTTSLMVVMVKSRVTAGVAEFATVREEVAARYIEEETARLAAIWLNDLRTDALIDIKIEELVPVD